MTEGPFEGSRCLARIDHGWTPATIRRAYPDGTFRVELDERSPPVLPYWYGVTPSELVFDDGARWPACREALALRGPFGLPELQRFVAFHGPAASAAAVAGFWIRIVPELFGVDPPWAAAHALDPDDAYLVIVRAGYSATETLALARGELPREPDARVYSNRIRMGGRSAREMPRPITVEDALDALGLPPAAPEPARGELPPELRRYLAGLAGTPGVTEVHPNHPHVACPGRVSICGLRRRGLDGELGVPVLEHHHLEWVAVFDPGDSDARVYVHWTSRDGESWRRAAPSVGMFFWDLAQTGLCWWLDTGGRCGNGKPVRRTDVGLALMR